jgi:hypothetical protein
MSDGRTKSFRFIVPVDNIPGTRDDKSSLYADIIKEFLASKIKYAEVTLEEKDTAKLKRGLKYYNKKYNVADVEVRQIGKKVYLERMNSEPPSQT